MGNAVSDINDNVKAQAGGERTDTLEIYKLINVSGGGELVRLTKAAIQSKDFSHLDNFIKSEVIKYLYNYGNGEHVNN
jgi:hypothetical protein